MSINDIKAKYPAGRFMPVIITEVTRMTKGNYCVAGWDVHGDRMVRPLQALGSNWRLGIDRSVFVVGNLVNCVPTGACNQTFPHATEDLRLAAPPTLLESFDESTTHTLLLPTCFQSISEIWGQELIDDKYIAENTQCRSLAGVRVSPHRVDFIEDGFGKLRLRLRTSSDEVEYWFKVTCDKLQHFFSTGEEDTEPHFGVSEANQWLQENPPNTDIILRIGLARGWDGRDKNWNPRRCYVQLNGIICPTDNFHIFTEPSSE